MLFTLNAVFTVDEIVASVSQYHKSPRGKLFFMEVFLNLFLVL